MSKTVALKFLQMSLVTLTTDYGSRDPYAAALKGRLYTEVPDARIVDISHEVSPLHLEEAAFLLGHSFGHYPKGSIHLVAVDEGHSKEVRPLLMLKEGHWFIGPDNGVLHMIRPEIRADQLLEIDFRSEATNFPALDIYVPAAAHLLRSGAGDLLGHPTDTMIEKKIMRPTLGNEKASITGIVQHIDAYGNLISNIPGSWIKEYQGDRSLEIDLGRRQKISKLCTHYREMDDGLPLALINSMGYLEIAVKRQAGPANNGASQLLGLYLRDRIEVRFT